MGDEEQRAGVVGEGGLEALDRGQVEVVGGLVEDEAPGAAGEAAGEQELAGLAG